MKNNILIRKIECLFFVLLIFCISHLVAEPCGDVNSSNGINIVDALLIAQFYVGLDPADFDEAAADVNADGKINIVDALLIAQYYVGLISELPGCSQTPTPTPNSYPTATPVGWTPLPHGEKTRVIATTDGEIDDECSLVRFLLYANDFDIQGIITSSSQYHWQGHNWAGDDWQDPYLDAYEDVYPNLVQHDSEYPTPAYIRAQSHLGNVKDEGDMDAPTEGSNHIVSVLLDDTNDRPIWLQAWGGMNTIARALKTIEDDHHEADSVGATVSINNSSSQTGASFTVPNESGKQVHIICEVKDNGTPVLTRYKRIIAAIFDGLGKKTIPIGDSMKR